MKGPFERLKYDLRRLWECPHCKRRERTDGTVTFRFCSCPGKEQQGKLTVMKLVEEAGHRAVPSIVCVPSEEPTQDDIPPQLETGLEAHPTMPAAPTEEPTPPALPPP